MEKIRVSNMTVDLVRKDIKNIHLAVYPPTGRVRIAAPLNVGEESIRLYALSKLAWIRRNQRKFEKQERQTPRSYKERESHYFLGKRYLLRVKETSGAGYVEVAGKSHLDLYVKPGASVDYKHKVMTEWYRAELRKITPKLIQSWEKKLDVTLNEWGIRKMKTKWGSCNIEQKRIWLNLELAKKPLHCIEYIIVHEMIHLLERHHNDHFKSYLDTYLPNWKQIKDELNRMPVSHEEWGK